MKRGVAKLWICGAVMTAFLCMAILPMTVEAQPTRTYPPGGITDPAGIEGVYKFKTKERCFKWNDGQQWRVLEKEPLWMVLMYLDDEIENGVKAAQRNGFYCPYQAYFFERTGKGKKALKDDLSKDPVGQGNLCFEFPRAFGEDLETWVVDGWMCKLPGIVPEDLRCYMEFVGWFKRSKRLPPKKLKGNGLMWCGVTTFFEGVPAAAAIQEPIPKPTDYLKCDMRWWAKRITDDVPDLEVEPPCDQWTWLNGN